MHSNGKPCNALISTLYENSDEGVKMEEMYL